MKWSKKQQAKWDQKNLDRMTGHTVNSAEDLMKKVYIVNYRGTIYGVFDSREKALASEYGDYLDAQILERVVL